MEGAHAFFSVCEDFILGTSLKHYLAPSPPVNCTFLPYIPDVTWRKILRVDALAKDVKFCLERKHSRKTITTRKTNKCE